MNVHRTRNACISTLGFISTVIICIILDVTVNGRSVWGDENSIDTDWTRPDLVHWCERAQVDRFVRTPVNAYSALAFVLLGWVVVYVELNDRKADLNGSKDELKVKRGFVANHSIVNWIQALTLIWGGLASFWNHSSINFYSREPDRASVWSLVGFPVTLVVLRFFQVPASNRTYLVWACSIIAINLAACIGHLAFGRTSVANGFVYAGVPVMVGLIVVLMIARALLPRRIGSMQKLQSNWKLLVAAFVCAGVGVLCQDPNTLHSCDPDGHWYKKTHSFWHVFMALSLFLLWRYFYEEIVVPEEGFSELKMNTAGNDDNLDRV